MNLHNAPGPAILTAKRRILAAWSPHLTLAQAVEKAAVHAYGQAVCRGATHQAARATENFIRVVGEHMVAALNDLG